MTRPVLVAAALAVAAVTAPPASAAAPRPCVERPSRLCVLDDGGLVCFDPVFLAFIAPFCLGEVSS